MQSFKCAAGAVITQMHLDALQLIFLCLHLSAGPSYFLPMYIQYMGVSEGLREK